MPGLQKSLRLPEETMKEIEEIAKETGRDFSAIVKDLLAEAIKMRRCPGIVFAEGSGGRRARVVGTGIEVWEIVSAYRSVGEDLQRLQSAYHWLSPEQLRAALSYYAAYPQEIERQIKRNESWTESKIRERHPFIGSHSGS